MVTLLSPCNSRQLLPVVTCQANLTLLIKTIVKHSFLYWGGFTGVQSRCTAAFLYISSRNCEFSFVYKRKEQQLQANGVVQGCQGARGIRHTSWSSESVAKAGLSDGAKAERGLEVKERDGCWAGRGPCRCAHYGGAAVNSNKNVGYDLTNAWYYGTWSAVLEAKWEENSQHLPTEGLRLSKAFRALWFGSQQIVTFPVQYKNVGFFWFCFGGWFSCFVVGGICLGIFCFSFWLLCGFMIKHWFNHQKVFGLSGALSPPDLGHAAVPHSPWAAQHNGEIHSAISCLALEHTAWFNSFLNYTAPISWEMTLTCALCLLHHRRCAHYGGAAVNSNKNVGYDSINACLPGF